jgi:tRNA(Ile)-lysidine synthase
MPQTTSKKKHGLFCLNFRKHLESFISDHGLVRADRKMIVSVSGGVDSLALADVLHALKFDLELLHFNHGTRGEENAQEEILVRAFAQERSLKIRVVRLNFSLTQNNFEKQSRLARQKIYREFINQGYWVYTAHHIDDSFEWSLMQSFKQSSLKSALGIPVFNNGIARPFMCVTKKQIKRYARARKISWLEDSSNNDDHFERNFLRQHITKGIYERYPSVLAHYVSRSNQMIANEKKSSDFIVKKEAGGIVITSKNLKFHKEELKYHLYSLSKKSRGEVDQEINKLIKSQEEIFKNPASFPFKGPMNFSGGVSLYVMKDKIFLTSETQRKFYQAYDEVLKEKLEKMAQIPERVIISEFPYLVISSGKRPIKSSKYIHPLLSVTCLWLKNKGISYSFNPLINSSNRQSLAFDAVILDSSVLGL